MKLTIVEHPLHCSENFILTVKEYFTSADEANDFIKEENLKDYKIYEVDAPDD